MDYSRVLEFLWLMKCPASRESGICWPAKQKLYMKMVEVPVNSITANLQKLYLDADDMAYLKGKRVLLVDDVISTGESIHALEQLVNYAKGEIVGKACVLAEGDAAQRKDIIFLEPLPLFFK